MRKFLALSVLISLIYFENCTSQTTSVSFYSANAGGIGEGLDGKPGPGDWIRSHPSYKCPSGNPDVQAKIVVGDSVSQVEIDNCKSTPISISTTDPQLNYVFYNPNYFTFSGGIFEKVDPVDVSYVNQSLCRFKNSEKGIDVVITKGAGVNPSAKVFFGRYDSRETKRVDFQTVLEVVSATSANYESPDKNLSLIIYDIDKNQANVSGNLRTSVEGSLVEYPVICQWTNEVPVLKSSNLSGLTYFIDRSQGGSDGNDGRTESAPFFSIARCASAVRPGDSCIVKNGIYTENIMLRQSGTAGNIIVFKNYPGHRPLVNFTGTTASARWELLAINPQTPMAYITIEGFELTNGQNDGLKYTNGNNLIIRNNYFHDLKNGAALRGQSGYQIIIDSNRFINNSLATGSYSVSIGGSEIRFTNNIIQGSTFEGIMTAARPFSPASHPDANYAEFKQNIIANNTFAFNGGPGMVIWTTGGSRTYNNLFVNNILFQNCTTCGAGGTNGITFSGPGADTNSINNNLFFTANTSLVSITGTEGTNYTQANNLFNTLNPLFVNAPTDLHLQSTSPAIDQGVVVPNLTNDADGSLRPQGGAYDLGAFEER